MQSAEKTFFTVSLLREIAKAISSSGPDLALRFVVESAISVTEAWGATLLVPHPKLREMIPIVKEFPAGQNGFFQDEAFRNFCFQAFLDGKSLVLDQTEICEKIPVLANQIIFVRFEPVILASKPIGLLVVFHTNLPGDDVVEDRTYFEILCPFMGTLIENSRLNNEMLHKNSRLSALYEISQRAESLIDLRDVYDSLEDVVGSFIDFDRFLIYFLTPDGKSLETTSTSGDLPFPIKIPLGEGIIGKAAQDRLPQLTYTDEFKSVLILPVVVSEKLIGVVVVASRKSYVYRDEDIIGLRIITTQIASIDEMFKDLVRLRGFTQHILQSMNAGVIIFDNNGRANFSNSAVIHIVGQPIPEGWSPKSEGGHFPEKLRELFLEVLETKSAVENRKISLDRFVPPKTLEINAFPFRDEMGTMLGTAFFLRDITQNLRLEERLKRADRLSALGVLAAGVAHEIRNPLTGMKMIVQLLMGEFSQGDPKLEPLQLIQNEIERLERIIINLLDFARPSKPQMTSVLLPEILEGCYLLVKNQMQKASLVLRKEYNVTSPAVIADPGQLKQVFLNILTNAIQASHSGGTITIKIEEKDEFWVTSIIDTGVGIPKKLLKTIFDPFITTKDDGTGLGLSVALRIVEEHGGRIEVESTEGQGSSFSVFLPKASKYSSLALSSVSSSN